MLGSSNAMGTLSLVAQVATNTGPQGTTSDRAVGAMMAAPWVGEVYPPFIPTRALAGISSQGSLQSASSHC